MPGEATTGEEEVQEVEQALICSDPNAQQGVDYFCATWGTVGGQQATNYVLYPNPNGSFSYGGTNSGCCQGTDMRNQPGVLCPRQPDGSCAYNVGYGQISYLRPNYCAVCDD